MIIEDEDSLKTWIIKDVASLTDADADRLALYVIALLKKPLSDNDLVELCLDKLDVFLQSHTKDFVNRLFQCLKDGSHLPEGSNTGAIEDLVLTDASDQEESPTKWDFESQDVKTVLKFEERDNKEKRDIVEFPTKRSSSIEKLTTATSSIAASAAQQPRSSRRRISPPSSSGNSGNERHGRGVGSFSSQRFSPSRSRRSNVPSRRTPPLRGRSERYHRRRSYSRSKSRSRSPHREKRRDDHEGSGRRHRCRDFHEKGFCMRGDKCSYDHGPDPVVIENAALEKIVNRSSGTAVVSPVASATLYSPSNPPPPGVDKGTFSTISEAYNPEAPALSVSSTVGKMDFSVPPPPLPPHLASAMPAVVPLIPSVYASTIPPSSSALVTVVPNAQTVQAYNPTGSGIVVTSMAAPTLANVPQESTLNNNGYSFGNISAYGHRSMTGHDLASHHGFVSRRGGRGRFKPYGATPLVNPALCSLLVKKIPPEQNKIVMLDQHFGKFGQITNLHVQYEGQPDTALVTFKTRREALSAYKSTEPIFNNRFIKVYWQTQMPESSAENGSTVGVNAQQTGVPSIQARSVSPNGAVVNMTENTDVGQQPIEGDLKSAITPSVPFSDVAILKRAVYNPRVVAAKKKLEHENLLKLVELHRRKTELYTKQIEQQKDLLHRIQTTENKELKKKIMELVNKSDESMKLAKADLELLSEKISTLKEKQKVSMRNLLSQNTSSTDEESGNNAKATANLSGKNSNGDANLHVNNADLNCKESVTNIAKMSAASKKKLFRVLLVSGCPEDLFDDLIVHMEKFGELFDFDITPRSSKAPCMFTYKNPSDAQRAVSEAAKSFTLATIDVDWAPVSLGQNQSVVPDGQRKPGDQMTPAALLASLEYEDDEEDEDLRREEDSTRSGEDIAKVHNDNHNELGDEEEEEVELDDI